MPEVIQEPFAALDCYELRHLFEHLAERKRGIDMQRLLLLETGEGRNAWYAAQDRVDDLGRYVSDIGLARQEAERESSRSVESRSAQVLYMLMLASVNSIANRLSVHLVVDATRAGLWSVHRGRAVARRLPDDFDRALALSALAPLTPDDVDSDSWSEALQAVRDIRLQVRRAKAIEQLGESLPAERLPSLREILLAIDDRCYRANAALDFAMRSQADEVKRGMLALATALQLSIDSTLQSSQLLTKCLRVRAQLGEFPEAWNDLNMADRVSIVRGAAECFRAEDIEQACAVAMVIAKPRERSETLADIAVRAARILDRTTATKILANIDIPDIRDAGLARAAVVLGKAGDLNGARETSREIRQASVKCVALARIASMAPAAAASEIGAEARKVLRSVFNVRSRGECLTALALGAARAGDAGGAEEIVQQITLPQLRTAAWCAIAPYLANPAPVLCGLARTEPYETLAPAIAAMDVEAGRIVLRSLIRQLNEISDQPQCISAIAGFAALRADDYGDLISSVQAITDPSMRSTVLMALARQAPAPVLEQLHVLAKSIADATLRAVTVAVVLPRRVALGYALVPALNEAMALPDPKASASALLDLAEMAPSDVRQEILARALKASRLISSPVEQAEVLVGIARQESASAEPIWNALLDMVEGYASRFRDRTDVEGANRAQLILRAAAPHLPALQTMKALEIAISMADLPDVPLLIVVQRLIELNEIAPACGAADAISSNADKIRARLALWRSAPSRQGEAEWKSMIVAAQELTNEQQPRILAELAANAPRLSEKISLLRAATQSVEGIKTDRVVVKPDFDLDEQVEVLLLLAIQWLAIGETATAMALWGRVLRGFGLRSRNVALMALPAIVKMLESDPEATYFAHVTAVRKVARWWP